MEHQYTEADLIKIAQQLACPQGDHGIKTGEVMNISNAGMTQAAINLLQLKGAESVLEIGHGNGGHIAYLLNQANELKYHGVDISPTMITEAERINLDFIGRNSVSFSLTDGLNLPFSNQSFEKVFSVNTLYFWKNPQQYLKEIFRVMKPKGTLVIAFADKMFMESLPFTKHGFTLYEKQTVMDIVKNAAFNQIEYFQKSEQIKSSAGNLVNRTYHLLSAKA